MLVLDSGGLSFLAKRNQDAAATIQVFVRNGLWPPVVPSVLLAEPTSGCQRNDANILPKTCDLVEDLPEALARRAGELRHKARRGSAVDAILVATAEPGGTVLTGDQADLNALASYADRVGIQRI
ncbi:MAG: PIN domain-containing protein [Acidimicrobiaceae bacterium]|nr:PIN domain-containing protein [Acidimicrobiaceae bacterium]